MRPVDSRDVTTERLLLRRRGMKRKRAPANNSFTAGIGMKRIVARRHGQPSNALLMTVSRLRAALREAINDAAHLLSPLKVATVKIRFLL